ncbi:dicarboxylate transporter/tellurite-resistance protein TehA [Methylobacterium radiodurans]|uniref:Dicarboxylate transporter/tellurite-resistance protein TehA n=1 Tax=Methylobacterium radiodurans TaxID=2202828 RepID=A0A2U8VLW9_9HYPH|nr:dicarboxylate transporter/tellurite-resistance protein TehA [Methylobacterium radiodurans]AWN34386.1 dicarboxylate transporter/tellurite-resistance protein TehA [Methylobacterium radiodurans]
MNTLSLVGGPHLHLAQRLRDIAANTPAAYFGIVLGLAGLGGAWRAASLAWHLPAFVGEAVYTLAGAVWAVLVVLYALKAILAPDKLAAEVAHPVQCCFIGLAGVATMLVAGGFVTYSPGAATVLFGLGFLFTLGFAVWRTGGLWQGGRDHGTTTAVLYLPTVAGSFVTATVGAAIGLADWDQLAFGAGLFSWLAMESVLLHRLLTGTEKPAALRPTLGIQLAPAPVGAVAYLSVGGGAPDVFAHALIGYGLLQVLVLARLAPWIAKAGLVPGLWAFSFGATAMATAPVRLVAHGDTGAVALLAPVLFIAANGLILGLAAMTITLLARGMMFPSPAGQARA